MLEGGVLASGAPVRKTTYMVLESGSITGVLTIPTFPRVCPHGTGGAGGGEGNGRGCGCGCGFGPHLGSHSEYGRGDGSPKPTPNLRPSGKSFQIGVPLS